MLIKKPFCLQIFLVLTCIMLCSVAQLNAGRIYMAPPPTGSDEAGNGSRQSPFATLEQCSKSIAGAYNYAQLRGDTIILLPGTYPHERTFIGSNTYFRGKDADHPLVVMGDPVSVAQGNKPVYYGAFDSEFGVGIYIDRHYSGVANEPEDDAQYIVIKDIVFKDFYYYGINLNDGGSYSRLSPAHHILIEGCEFITGPGHIRHGLKLTGVDDFEVRNCLFVGIRYNCIDGVGLHDGHIHDNIFRDCQTGTDEGNGVMCKGGSRNVLIEKNLFLNLHCYGVQIGQLTGPDLVRPPYGTPDGDGETMDYEAKNIDVFRNIFINVVMPIKWDCARGGRVYQNTFYTPSNYGNTFGANRLIKIAQIHKTWDGYKIAECRGGKFINNVIYYGETEGWPSNRVVWVQNAETQPETFEFRNNIWYCVADPARSMPDWSTLSSLYGCPQHADNITGDPLFIHSGTPTEPVDFFLDEASPARNAGLALEGSWYDFLDQPYAVPPTLGALEIPAEGAPPLPPRSLHIYPPTVAPQAQKRM